MKFEPTKLSDVILIKPQIFADERGFFLETRHEGKFAEAGIKQHFVQDNHSKSSQGILRGLHYQIKQPQGKLVRVIEGEIFDVAVDIRKNSNTFGQWIGASLSADNKHQFWVPPGFAHGFYVLSETAEVLYSCTDFYAPEYDRSILWNDPDIGIEWPLLSDASPTLSDKDKSAINFKQADVFV